MLPQEDGSFLVDGSANLRELVRTMHWELPTDGPKDLNGLIVEYLESLPDTGTLADGGRLPIEVVQIQDNAVKTARIRPQDRRQPEGGLIPAVRMVHAPAATGRLKSRCRGCGR